MLSRPAVAAYQRRCSSFCGQDFRGDFGSNYRVNIGPPRPGQNSCDSTSRDSSISTLSLDKVLPRSKMYFSVVIVASLLIPITSLMPTVGGTYGVDVSSSVRQDDFKCLKNNGIDFVIVRAYQSLGQRAITAWV